MSGLGFDDLPDAVVVVDADWRIETANTRAASILGYEHDALVGARVDELLDPRGRDGQPVWADGWPRATELGSVARVPEQTVQVRRADGTDLRLAVTGRYRRASDGSVDGLVLSARPLHRRELEDTSGIEIVSTVSHELRSPLTSVKGFVSLMLNRWDRLGDEQKREMLEQVHIDAERVTRLVTELLDISRLETGRLKLRRKMIELPPLIEKVVSDVKNLHANLEPAIILPKTVPEVYADPDKIMQVLTNLVENTGKYAEGKGVEVRVTVAEAQDGADGEDEMVTVAVSDRGPGIPEDDLGRVFTKFYRSGEGRPTGSGLGLYIAKGIVEAHGGAMWLDSRLGEGCTFSFSLPAGVPEELEVDAAVDEAGS